jgi:hypothetical protein
VPLHYVAEKIWEALEPSSYYGAIFSLSAISVIASEEEEKEAGDC